MQWRKNEYLEVGVRTELNAIDFPFPGFHIES